MQRKGLQTGGLVLGGTSAMPGVHLDEIFTEVAQPLCALSMCHKFWPWAMSKHIKRPSLQPVTRMSSEAATEIGYARVLVGHRNLAL